MSRAWAWVLAAVASTWASGCLPEERSELLSSSPIPSEEPRDTVAPNEIAEGDVLAFGLVLPRKIRVQAQAKDVTYAVGRLSFEDLANYIRDRVTATRVDTGPAQTVFVDAIVKRDPKHVVQVEVRNRHGRVQLVVRDRTPKPVEQGLTEAERWRRAGLTPDGQPIKEQAE